MVSNIQSTAQHMFDIIAASFFQKKSCILPGIGQLAFTNTTAVTDFFNSQILAPKQAIVFIPAANEGDPSFNEFSAISELMKSQLEKDGQVIITGVGSFTKLSGGQLYFKAANPDPVFFQPVQAVRVLRPDAEHNVLVGDKETTSTAMNEMLQVEEEHIVKKDRWWIWAIIGLALAAAVIAYYLYQYGFNSLGSKM